jgi:hypothetical protein
MIMPDMTMVVTVALTAVGAAFGLERTLHPYKFRSEAMEHLLDHMVGPNAEDLVSNFGRQMSISQMPGKAHKLIRISMPDFDNRFRSGPNLEPSPIFKLQAVSIGHRDRFRKVEKNIFALIRGQPNATAMARVKIESESAGRLFRRPKPGWSMN